jgi:prepilin-type N-terminal cleavage/methylation domain-containing protein
VQSSRHRNRRAEFGFTLIELMIVVTIIGVIATIGIPNLIKLAHKSRRSEAVLALKAIQQNQQEYFGRHGRYADTFDDMGFELPATTQTDSRTIIGSFYTYTVEALTVGGVPNANFRAVAAGDIDGDPVLDVLVAENQLTVN